MHKKCLPSLYEIEKMTFEGTCSSAKSSSLSFRPIKTHANQVIGIQRSHNLHQNGSCQLPGRARPKCTKSAFSSKAKVHHLWSESSPQKTYYLWFLLIQSHRKQVAKYHRTLFPSLSSTRQPIGGTISKCTKSAFPHYMKLRK